MDERFYSGAAKEDIRDAKAIGIRHIDLQASQGVRRRIVERSGCARENTMVAKK